MPTLFIDKTLLKKNIEITKELAGESHIIGVVKGNGYGLGLCSYAHILIESGVEILAVTDLNDAICMWRNCRTNSSQPFYLRKSPYLY